MESGRLGTAYRTSAPPGPAAAGPRGKFRRSGNHRGRMLGVLKFKKSLFAGVLDGGEKEIFLGGSRLNRFMETVEQASGAIPSAAPIEQPQLPGGTAEKSGRSAVSARTATNRGPSSPKPAESLSSLLQAGVTFLQELVLVSRLGASESPRLGSSFVRRNQRTGETYLRFTMPKPEALDQALGAISALLESLQ